MPHKMTLGLNGFIQNVTKGIANQTVMVQVQLRICTFASEPSLFGMSQRF